MGNVARAISRLSGCGPLARERGRSPEKRRLRIDRADRKLTAMITMLRAIAFALMLPATLASAENSLPAEPIPAPDDVAAPPADAQKTESGLASKVLTAGKGSAHPAKTDVVTVHYTGWTTDGKMFDTSRTGKPATFPLNKVIAGWTEGVQLMVAGEKRRCWIPESLAYAGNGPVSGDLVFEIELIKIN